jgi:5'(3')-deoxyribonucleotidase
MDGVIADFVGGACLLHQVDNPYDNPKNHGYYELRDLLGLTKQEFTHGMEHGFWEGLDVTSCAHSLVVMCLNYVDISDLCILTSPTQNQGCPSGKRAWLKERFPELKYLIGNDKTFCAGPGRILIDDYDVNIESFKKSGGEGFLVPRPWNSGHKDVAGWLDRLDAFLRSYT